MKIKVNLVLDTNNFGHIIKLSEQRIVSDVSYDPVDNVPELNPREFARTVRAAHDGKGNASFLHTSKPRVIEKIIEIMQKTNIDWNVHDIGNELSKLTTPYKPASASPALHMLTHYGYVKNVMPGFFRLTKLGQKHPQGKMLPFIFHKGKDGFAPPTTRYRGKPVANKLLKVMQEKPDNEWHTSSLTKIMVADGSAPGSPSGQISALEKAGYIEHVRLGVVHLTNKGKEADITQRIERAYRERVYQQHVSEKRQPRQRQQWTEEAIEELKKYSNDKTPVPEISELMNRSQGSLRQKALELGIPLGHRR